MNRISNRIRKDFTKQERIIPAIYFDESYTNAIRFVETSDVVYPGVRRNYYTADSEGNVYNPDGTKMVPFLINSGYYVYHLVTEKGSKQKMKNVTAHRLILSTFNPIENEELFTVNHINMNTADNRLCNLEWVAQSDNNRKKLDVSPNDGCNNYQSTFNRSQLEIIISGLDSGMKYKDILRSLGIDPSDNNCDYIGNIKRGITYKKEAAEIRANKFNDYP